MKFRKSESSIELLVDVSRSVESPTSLPVVGIRGPIAMDGI